MGDYHSELIKLAGKLYGAYEEVQGNVSNQAPLSGSERASGEREGDKMRREVGESESSARMEGKEINDVSNGYTEDQ